MAGTEIQANILATLEDQAFIATPFWLNSWLWLLAAGAILGHAFSRLSLEAGLVVAVVHHFAWKVVALAAFVAGDWRVEMVAMLLLGTFAYGATFALRWRALRRMMGVVKSEALVQSLEADPTRLDSAGEEREITVLFADVRGFTAFSNDRPPQQVVALLNAYFSAVVPVVEAEGGTVDKFIGDGLMVLFNAPTSCDNHPVKAVRAAAAMVRKVHENKKLWTDLGNPEMRIGVGVHTGKAVIGAIGGRQRVDYTAIGEAVNTASRIESANKELGTEVLISAATYEILTDDERASFHWTEAVRAELKGIPEPLTLYPIVVQ
jgi:adenylate cyclase